jgi:hypothetical protein
MLNKIKCKVESVFKRINKHEDEEIHPRSLYAIVTGAYVGEMWCFVDQVDDNCRFISIPKNTNREATIKNVEHALKYGIMEYVETVDNDMADLLKQQFNYNEISNTGRE